LIDKLGIKEGDEIELIEKEIYHIVPIAFPNCPKDRGVLNEEEYLWMKI